ncbi:MAG: glycosyltransferase family 4 protein [Chloroflexota bacterium]|nr:glycosyltransferase family 4 protein [Chloroflexota bacterium]
MRLAFFYPQFKKLTGAERLILKLAGYTARRLKGPGDAGEPVVLLTHRFAAECRPALAPGVRLVETGWPLQLTGNHYLDAAVEYAMGPLLALKLPHGLSGILFFGPPSVPAMWFARHVLLPLRRTRPPLLYFCFEPPRFIYSDTVDIVRRLGRLGKVLHPLMQAYRLLDKAMTASAARVLSNSPYGSRRIMAAYGRRSTIIEHGVDFASPLPEAVQGLRERYSLQGRRVAVTVNHLHPRKRIDLFLRAVHVAAQELPGTTALVVGGGPELVSLRALASELGMREGREVIFTGAVTDGELPAHYALGTVYVHTGREESFGLSVIEALSLGLPVVSVAEGGPCDTVQHGVSGYLVPAEPQTLGAAIARLLADTSLAEEMGRAGAGFVYSHFSWEAGANTLLRVLSEEKSRRLTIATRATRAMGTGQQQVKRPR